VSVSCADASRCGRCQARACGTSCRFLFTGMNQPQLPAARRVLDQEGDAALERIALHSQLCVLLPQPHQLSAPSLPSRRRP
jgi:hypothetical protein